MSDPVIRPLPARAQRPTRSVGSKRCPRRCIGIDAGERIRFVNAAAAELLAGVGRGLLGRRLDEIFGPDAPLVGARAPRARRRGRRCGSRCRARRPGLRARPRHRRRRPGGGERLHRAGADAPAARARCAAGRRHIPPRARSRTKCAIRSPAFARPRSSSRAATIAESAALAKLICDEVDRIRRLTDRIDPFGAFEPPRFEPFNIHEALERVRKLIGSSAPDVMIRERYDPSLPPVRGDLDQLIQAFLNIAKNAAEAVAGQADGEIAIITSYRPGVKFRSAASGAARAQLEVQIVDNGPGLHPDVADRLFEAFATTKSRRHGPWPHRRRRHRRAP